MYSLVCPQPSLGNMYTFLLSIVLSAFNADFDNSWLLAFIQCSLFIRNAHFLSLPLFIRSYTPITCSNFHSSLLKVIYFSSVLFLCLCLNFHVNKTVTMFPVYELGLSSVNIDNLRGRIIVNFLILQQHLS